MNSLRRHPRRYVVLGLVLVSLHACYFATPSHERALASLRLPPLPRGDSADRVAEREILAAVRPGSSPAEVFAFLRSRGVVGSPHGWTLETFGAPAGRADTLIRISRAIRPNYFNTLEWLVCEFHVELSFHFERTTGVSRLSTVKVRDFGICI